ncbi:TPA: chromosome partitioning protein ParB, partial [Bacillus pacificus]|nr:chromosome partitioning protein ParB [Bacillus pacificus]
EKKIIPFDENTYKLDEKILVYLSKISSLAKEEITQILNFLIKLGADNGNNIESLLERLDTAIPTTQVINYASGL